MARCLVFDDNDKAALDALGGFTIGDDGETATAVGKMKVEILRPAPPRNSTEDSSILWVYITLPSGEQLFLRADHDDLLEIINKDEEDES